MLDGPHVRGGVMPAIAVELACTMNCCTPRGVACSSWRQALWLLVAIAIEILPDSSQVLLAVEPEAVESSQNQLLDATFELKLVAGDCKFTEGPVVDAQGNLLFSDSENDRIMQVSPAGEVSEFRKPCGRANGLMFDREGRLLMCQSVGQGGKQRVARLEADGTETVLADKYDGKPFVAPNDLCVDGQGRIYFTDPIYGDASKASQPTSGVYRIDAPGKVTRIIADLKRPNGIVLTADDRLLYVSDRGTQKLHRYQLAEDGSVEPAGVVYDFSPDRGIDGMWLDEKGNIYGAAGQEKTTGLYVVSPAGKLLLHFPLPEYATNVTFGGADRRDLYLTAGKSVYQLRSVIPGMPLPWSKATAK